MFIDAYIDQCAGFGFVGGPTFNTRITHMRNKSEFRNGDWDDARHVYSAPYLNIKITGYRSLRTMFYVCRGRLHCFRYRDPNDDEPVVNEPFGVGDGATSIFYLSKISEADGVTYDRRVALPINPVVYVNGVPDTPDINIVTGVVDFGSSPPGIGDALTWSADAFDVKVRFDQDELPFSLDSPDARNGSVNLIEVSADET